MNQIQLQLNAALREAAAPVHTTQHLSAALRGRLCQWIPDVFDSGVHRVDSDKLAHPKATAIVAIYDDALARLEGKTGSRADASRKQIRAARAPLAEALDLVNSIQGDFGGPLGRTLQKRIASTRAGLASALAAKEVATRDTIDAAVLECERCLADIRELDRDLASIYEGLIVPWKRPGVLWPEIDDLCRAESSTLALQQLSPKRLRAAEVHTAIEMGLKAPAHEAMLWPAYETAPDHPLIQWRAQALAERG